MLDAIVEEDWSTITVIEGFIVINDDIVGGFAQSSDIEMILRTWRLNNHVVGQRISKLHLVCKGIAVVVVNTSLVLELLVTEEAVTNPLENTN